MALQLQREIRGMMEMLHFPGWIPELVATRAREGVGVDLLWAAIERHDAFLRASGELETKRANAFAHRVRALVMGDLAKRVDARIGALVHAADRNGVDPYRVAAAIIGDAARGLPDAGDARVAESPIRASVKGL